LFISHVQQTVRWQDECRLFRNEEILFDVQIELCQLFNLGFENDRVENNTVADYISCRFTKNARRDLMEYMFDSVEFKGMTGVRSTLKPGNHIVSGRQNINNFAFAFVAPLKAK